ncbi:MAG TPA: hypothetical protein VI544_02420 [Candidatus Nanoarchaeia archaeon]|nr:hypothetical protein [Candidatus Nanoarchaeia archaeon]
MKNKNGQIAIWVILALVLVGAISLFFLLERRTFGVAESTFGPEQYIAQCTREVTAEVADIIIPQGGFLDSENFKIYNDTKVPYLCRSYGFYVNCINQHPMFINEISEEIRGYIAPRIESCFEDMKKELEKRQAIVEFDSSPAVINVSLAPGEILVEIAKSVKITEKDTTKTFEKFDARTMSPIYNLASVAINIANNERKYCYFEYLGYMILDQSVDIRKFTMSDATKIYSIKDIASGKIFNIATRSCAMPAGF